MSMLSRKLYLKQQNFEQKDSDMVKSKAIISFKMLEITNGLQIYKGILHRNTNYSLMIFLVSMGGFCSIGQTQCVITAPEIKISHYFKQKY